MLDFRVKALNGYGRRAGAGQRAVRAGSRSCATNRAALCRATKGTLPYPNKPRLVTLFGSVAVHTSPPPQSGQAQPQTNPWQHPVAAK